jgi:hypothetical protein
VRKEKTRSWKECCTLISPTNPLTGVYKIAATKTRNTTMIMTLQKPDGTKTENTEETLKLLLDQLTPDDNPQDDTRHYKSIRKQTEQPLNTMNDKSSRKKRLDK